MNEQQQANQHMNQSDIDQTIQTLSQMNLKETEQNTDDSQKPEAV